MSEQCQHQWVADPDVDPSDVDDVTGFQNWYDYVCRRCGAREPRARLAPLLHKHDLHSYCASSCFQSRDEHLERHAAYAAKQDALERLTYALVGGSESKIAAARNAVDEASARMDAANA